MNVTAQYEYTDVLQAGEQFKLSLCFDDYGKQVVSKALVDSQDSFASSQLNDQIEFLKVSNHTGIVNFHDNTNSELFMEAMAGSVQELTRQSGKHFSIGEIVSFLRQMLALLSHLDSRNLTVGQLSPRTILANEDLSIFKISKAYQKDSPISADANETIFPPEINSADDYDVHASDIYCLGMTCVEMALGQTGFKGLFKGMYDDTSDLWIRWHENSRETLPNIDEVLEGFPKGLTDILQKMIEKSLHLRFASAEQVLSELNALGIVDGTTTVKKKSNLKPFKTVFYCTALAVFGLVGWNLLPQEEPVVVQADPVEIQVEVPAPPEKFEIEIESNQDFKYQIIRNNEPMLPQRFSSSNEKISELQVGDSIKIDSKDFRSKGWELLVNQETHSLRRDKMIAGLNTDDKFKLEFVRTYKLRSKYNDFRWRYDSLDVAFLDESLLRISDQVQTYIEVMPNDKRLRISDVPQSNGWFRVPLPWDHSSNTVDLEFELPVEVKLRGHSSLAKLPPRQLTVKVAGHSLTPAQGKYTSWVPCRSSDKSNWNVEVEHKGRSIAGETWDLSIPLRDSSVTKKEIELNHNVSFDLAAGFMLKEANGKTEFAADERDVKVLYGEKLNYVVTDRSGVIEFHKEIDWPDEKVKFSIDNYMTEKKLENQGSQATYWLERSVNSHVRKRLGVTNDKVSLPTADEIGDYRVVVEWSTALKREFPLREFLKFRKPIELWPAVVRTRQSGGSAGAGGVYAVKEVTANR